MGNNCLNCPVTFGTQSVPADYHIGMFCKCDKLFDVFFPNLFS